MEVIAYNKETAFGNTSLIKKLETERTEIEWKQNSKPCLGCDEKGGFTCDRGFDHECEECDGRGRIEK